MDNIIDKDTFDFIHEQVLSSIEDKIPDIETFVDYYINKICLDIVIKTNRNSFPKDLKYLVVELTKDAYAMYKSNLAEANQTIQSMSETGRTVNFGISDIEKTKYQLLINRQLNDNEQLINRYKLLYKTRCSYAKD